MSEQLGIWIQEFPVTGAIAFHTVGPTAREDSFQMMVEWMLQGQLPMGYIPRIFAYPKALDGMPGQEVLLSLPPHGSFTPAVSVRSLSASAYACVTSTKPEVDFVKKNIAVGPYYIYDGQQYVPTDNYGGIINSMQWMVEYHADVEDIENCIRTGLAVPQFHHVTIMVPIGRKS